MKNKAHDFVKHFKRDWQLYLIILIPAIYIGIFSYGSMYGVQIAFRNYKPMQGITGSEWVGLKWFKMFLTDFKFMNIFTNTISLALYSLVVGFPLPIIFALLINSLKSQGFKKAVQTITYMPHFISMAVMIGIVSMLLSPSVGPYGYLYRLFGGDGYPSDFRALEKSFRHIYVWSGVWQNLGWDTIIYTSALSAVSMELHEAAMIDGAGRLKRILYVDLPGIMPTVAITLILRFGHIVSVGFEKAFMLQSDLNLGTSEVISTYVYKQMKTGIRMFSYGSAVDLFNVTINVTLVLIVNAITRKLTDNEVAVV